MAARATSERESWIRANFTEDSFVGFASSEDLSFLVNRPDSFLYNGEKLYRSFSIKLILENLPRLTKEYNTRCLPLLKEHFGTFFDGLVDSESVFGKKALIPCEMRECDEEELLNDISYDISHSPYYMKAMRIEKYKKVRDQMRKNQMTFEPVTPELILLLYESGFYPPLNQPFKSLANTPAFCYGDGNFSLINGIFRSNKQYTKGNPTEIARVMSTVLPGLVFPFRTNNELVLWRADNMDVSTDELVVSGFLSTSLSRCFTSGYGDKRNLKINVPRNTPFLPVIINKNKHAEIALLPGTKLTRVREERFGDGSLFAEYAVTRNPEPFEDHEVATILRAAISWLDATSIDVPDKDEQLKFIYNLMNRRFGGDF